MNPMPASPEIQAQLLIRIIAEPVPTRSLFENVIQAAKADRHQHHAEVVRAFEQRKVGFVHAYQDGDQTRYQHAGHNVDVKQPLPRPVIRNPAAHDRTERRGQAGGRSDERGRDGPLLPANRMTDAV